MATPRAIHECSAVRIIEPGSHNMGYATETIQLGIPSAEFRTSRVPNVPQSPRTAESSQAPHPPFLSSFTPARSTLSHAPEAHYAGKHYFYISLRSHDGSRRVASKSAK